VLAAGVDPTGLGGAIAGFGDQRNYQLLREAGFTPAQVVQIMSLNGAKVLGVDDELGSVEPGKIADLAVMEGDLTSDPGAIRRVHLVFKDGVGFDSERLIESVKGRVGIN
jgi:imidazolonepropionase-like amidohydrolase